MYILVIFFVVLVERQPRWRKLISFFGLLLCIAGLIGGGFSKTVQLLIFTQGALFGIGGAILSANSQVLIPQWYEHSTGVCTAATWAASGIVGGFLISTFCNQGNPFPMPRRTNSMMII